MMTKQMTKQDYRAGIARLGYSITAAGPALGVSSRMSEYYASGHTQVPGPIAYLIEALLALESARELIAALLAESGERPVLRELYTFEPVPDLTAPSLCPE